MSKTGWRETSEALSAGIVVALVLSYAATVTAKLFKGAPLLAALLLGGCGDVTLLGKYTHNSDAEIYRDYNTTDMAGACLNVKLCAACADASPEFEVCGLKELTKKPVFGPTDDIIGEMELRFPVKTWRR